MRWVIQIAGIRREPLAPGGMELRPFIPEHLQIAVTVLDERCTLMTDEAVVPYPNCGKDVQCSDNRAVKRLSLTIMGIVLGIAAAYGLGSAMSSSLFGVSASGPAMIYHPSAHQ
jgi:hypothetical protein